MSIIRVFFKFVEHELELKTIGKISPNGASSDDDKLMSLDLKEEHWASLSD